MSELLSTPTSEDYDRIVHELNERIEMDYFDANGAVEAFKMRQRSSHSFFQLATRASKAALYFEEYTSERKLSDNTMPRARAFMRGILIAEIINEQLFDEEHHSTAFNWMISELGNMATINPEFANAHPKVIIQQQFQQTSETFMANFEDSTNAVLSRWAWQLAEPAFTGDVKVGMGVQLSAGYSYRSHKIQECKAATEEKELPQ